MIFESHRQKFERLSSLFSHLRSCLIAHWLFLLGSLACRVKVLHITPFCFHMSVVSIGVGHIHHFHWFRVNCVYSNNFYGENSSVYEFSHRRNLERLFIHPPVILSDRTLAVSTRLPYNYRINRVGPSPLPHTRVKGVCLSDINGLLYPNCVRLSDLNFENNPRAHEFL